MSIVTDSYKHTLCWDCKNSTKPWNCPWVDNFTPVKGWIAIPTHVGKYYQYDSFRVIECPKFKRSSFCGGLVEDTFSEKEPSQIDDKGCVALAEAIVERAVEDWKFLEYGALEEIVFCGGRIFKSEILEFFFSEWFEHLLESFTEYTPQQIRRYLKIRNDMRPKKEGVKKRA